MAYDAFLKIDGIPGESTDKIHPGEIQLDSYSFGETNSVRASTGSGAGAGRVSFQDFHFTSPVSKATPLLMLNCANGKHIPNAVLTVRKAGENPDGESTPFEFLFVKFKNVIVSSVQDAFTGGERPEDSVSLNFGSISVEYKEQKLTGGIGSIVNFAWDLVSNRKA